MTPPASEAFWTCTCTWETLCKLEMMGDALQNGMGKGLQADGTPISFKPQGAAPFVRTNDPSGRVQKSDPPRQGGPPPGQK